MAGAPDAVWLWNGDLTPAQIGQQLAAARGGGYRSLAVWPWAGLTTPFGNEPYLEAVRSAAEAASHAGVTLWLADDVHWPSGTAGGQLLVAHPEYAQRALVCSTCWTSSNTPQSLRWRGEGERLVLALALDDAGSRRDLALQLEERGRPVRERRSSTHDGYRARWECEVWEAELRLPAGEWFVTIATVVRLHALLRSAVGCGWSPAVTGALDVLDEAAVAAYVDRTLAPLVGAAGHHAGHAVAGIVSVAPPAVQAHAVAQAEGWRTDVLPWVHDFPELFERLFERQLATHLPYALAPLHEGQPSAPVERLWAYAEARRDELFVTGVGQWCEARGLGRLVLGEGALARLPVIPLSVRGERKRAIVPALAVGVRTVEDDSQAEVVAAGAAASLAAMRSPGAQAHGWETLHVFAPEWEWQPASWNVLPLGDWEEWEHAGRSRDGTVRFDATLAFEADHVPDDLALLLEEGIVEGVVLNGSAIPLGGGRAPGPEEIEWADVCHRLVRLHPSIVRSGPNTVVASAELGAHDRVLFEGGAVGGPLFLAGSFALKASGGAAKAGAARWRMVRPTGDVRLGEWGGVGYPRFSGTARYAQAVRLPALPERATVHLHVEAQGGPVALRIDGRLVERVGATPYVFDLTGKLPGGLARFELECASGLGPRLGRGVAGLGAVRLLIRS